MEIKETPINSTYLSKEELDHFKEKLIEEKIKSESEIKTLQASIDEIENKMDDTSSGSAHHQGDLGSSEDLRATNYTLIEKQKEKLEQITAALDRIETGNYGICIVTGNPIQKGRLEAIPYALHSVDAKKGSVLVSTKDQLNVHDTAD
tara:strand:+ start:91878 stop:92321 length:444 start_codon:yes stop_codon:yes gene_type:complete